MPMTSFGKSSHSLLKLKTIVLNTGCRGRIFALVTFICQWGNLANISLISENGRIIFMGIFIQENVMKTIFDSYPE